MECVTKWGVKGGVKVGSKRNEETEKRSTERVRNTNYGSEKATRSRTTRGI